MNVMDLIEELMSRPAIADKFTDKISSLDLEVRVFNIEEEILAIDSEDDFLALYPSQLNGDWFRVINTGRSFRISRSSGLTKGIYYDSSADRLFYVKLRDKEPVRRTLEVPPL